MKDSHGIDKQSFLYPRSRYYGQGTPAHLDFNANLQEFAQRAGIIASLQTAGKLSAGEAYIKIELHWKQLTSSMQKLGIETDRLKSSEGLAKCSVLAESDDG
jgi:transcriptional regulator with GAF, ATPase, and Fis domain